MTHRYALEGMTCHNCQKSVKDALESIDEIKEVEVDLAAGEATVTMDKHVSLETLQGALPSKFTISEIEQKQAAEDTTPVAETKSKFQQLKPLFIILFYIAMASMLLHYKNWDGQEVMLDFMGLFLIVFSFFKMLDLKGFPTSFRMYDPLAKRVPFYATIYPFIETALGLMFLFRYHVDIALIVTLVVLGITTIGVTRSLLDKRAIRCACLGTALNLPMTEATFIENAIMLVMGIILLANYM